MKIHTPEQGSREWLQLRLGIPTASQFHRIITPKTLEFSKQSREYAIYLITEKLLNEALNPIEKLEWVAWGKEKEPEAVKLYEFEQDVVTEPIGFITTNDGRMGCTPDRVINLSRPLERALEIKCPAPHTHVKWLLDGFGADYAPQVYGQLLIGEFETVDRYSYHPQLPPVLTRMDRDEEYISKLQDALDRFCDMKDELLVRVQSSGFFEERRALLTATDRQGESLQRDLEDYLGA